MRERKSTSQFRVSFQKCETNSKEAAPLIMPLSLVTTLAEADRQQCDIEFIQVTKDRLFTADGCLIKVYTPSPYPYFNIVLKKEKAFYPFILLSSSPKTTTRHRSGRRKICSRPVSWTPNKAASAAWRLTGIVSMPARPVGTLSSLTSKRALSSRSLTSTKGVS